MANAVGRKDAPLLIVLTCELTEGMQAWFLKLLHTECKIQSTDCRFVYMLDDPPKGASNRPLKTQLQESWSRFQGDIKVSTPEVVLALGADPLYYLTGIRERLDESRGYIITSKFFRNIEWKVEEQVGVYKTNNKSKGIKVGDPRFGKVTRNYPGLLGDFSGIVIPSYDPEFVRLTKFATKPALKEDIIRARRSLERTVEPIELTIWHTEWSDFLRDYEFDGVVSIDIETHGIDNDVIDLVSFSDGVVTASVPWSEETRCRLNYMFSNPNSLFAVHNSPFDIPRLRDSGVVIDQECLDHQIFDTMFAAVTLQPDLRKSLGASVTMYLDATPWKWRTISEADPVFYSAKDALMTCLLAEKEIEVMKNMGLWNLFMGSGQHPGPGVMATIPILSDLARRGIKTDRDHAEWWTGKLERKNLRLHVLWSKKFPGISPRSIKQIQELLYHEWGLPIQKNNENKISTDELALVKLRAYIQSDYALAHDQARWRNDPNCNPRTFDLLLALRDTAKTMGTYVQPVALNEIKRIFPYYLPVSKDDESSRGKKMDSKGNTSTGRLATFGPNIGNQPKKVRRIYVPDTENDCFIQGDWKAAELHVFARLAGDQRLLEDLFSQDMHSRNAERFNTTRDTAKNIIYASQYLAGASKVNEMILEQEHLYVPVSECKRIMNGLAEYYFKVAAYKRHLADLCETQKYIRNPFGRVRVFNDGRAPAAVDFMAQSTVADCLWCVLKAAADMAERFGGRLITTVYDSILIQVPKEYQDESARELKTIMEQKFDIVTPGFFIPVELELGEPGKSWAELKKVK